MVGRNPLAHVRLPLRIRPVSGEALAIEDATGLAMAYVYLDDGDAEKRTVRQRMTREEAEAVAKAMARGLTAEVEAALA